MILTLDIGNTQLMGGLFRNDKVLLQFRKQTLIGSSSDEIGLFLKHVIKENGFDSADVSSVAVCSVVPDINHSLASAIIKYFKLEPFFIRSGVKTGLKIRYKNPQDVGADRIANAIGAVNLFPQKNLVVVDFGTATTLDIISGDKTYLGGAIAPGIRISMQALEDKTAKLPKVEILQPKTACGQTTIDSIQAGLYYGQLGMVKEVVERVRIDCFQGQKPLVIGTGGFSRLFDGEDLFDEIVPDLVLEGIRLALLNNRGE